jgi:hypothetical protein
MALTVVVIAAPFQLLQPPDEVGCVFDAEVVGLLAAPYDWLLNSTSGIGTFFDGFALSFIGCHLTFWRNGGRGTMRSR